MAGSLRRRADAVKDLDIIATATDPAALAAALGELPLVESVQSAGEAGARVLTHAGMKVDLKVVEPDQFGNVLQHFTGSKAHNVALRESAVRRGLHVSEYGILDDETGETTRCATEEEVYERLGLAWIPPELREGRGELEAALPGGPGLPRLVTIEDIRGDLHCHTTLSDGRQTLEQMVDAAQKRGLEYLAVTDHSASHGFGDHVTPEALEERIEEVAALNASLDGFELLAGTEVNILPDGSLDYEDELLARLDWVVASVHTSFSMSEQEMTDRMIRAIEHPLVDVIGHPTGRKIETRPPYALDVERVIEAAARTGTMLEINAAPDRRDLNELHARAAAEAGVPILVDTDAHSARNFELLKYGIATARRAWLTPEQVANTRPWAEFAPMRKRSVPDAPNFLSALTGSFATPAAENPTVAMIEAAYRHHEIDARYLNCEVDAGCARRRGARRGGDGLGGLQLLDPAQGRGDRAPRRAGGVGVDHRRGQLRRAARRWLDRREHRRPGVPDVAAHGRRSGGGVGAAVRRRRRARAIAVELALAGAASITVVNRDPGRGQELVDLIAERTPAEAEFVEWAGTQSRARRAPTSSSTRPRSGSIPTSTRGSTSTPRAWRRGWSSPT